MRSWLWHEPQQQISTLHTYQQSQQNKIVSHMQSWLWEGNNHAMSNEHVPAMHLAIAKWIQCRTRGRLWERRFIASLVHVSYWFSHSCFLRISHLSSHVHTSSFGLKPSSWPSVYFILESFTWVCVSVWICNFLWFIAFIVLIDGVTNHNKVTDTFW